MAKFISDMDHPDAPKIEFPLDYAIKVIGDNHDNFIAEVAEIVCRFDENFAANKIVPIPSRKGTFVSLRFSFWATGKDQLDEMHQALQTLKAVKMVI